MEMMMFRSGFPTWLSTKKGKKGCEGYYWRASSKMPFCFTTTLLIFLSMTIINLLILETIVKSSNLGTFEVQIEN